MRVELLLIPMSLFDDYNSNNIQIEEDAAGEDMLDLLANPDKMLEVQASTTCEPAALPTTFDNHVPFAPNALNYEAIRQEAVSADRISEPYPMINPGANDFDNESASESRPSSSLHSMMHQPQQPPRMQDDMRLKAAALYELSRFDPHLAKRFNSNSPLQEIQFELERVKSIANSSRIIETMRDGTYTATSIIENVSTKFLPGYIHLKGWSTSVLTDLMSGRYDEVFLELYAKYQSTVDPPVEIKFLFMLMSSATMFHLMSQMQESVSFPPTQAAAPAAQPKTKRPQQASTTTNMRGPVDIADIVNRIRERSESSAKPDPPKSADQPQPSSKTTSETLVEDDDDNQSVASSSCASVLSFDGDTASKPKAKAGRKPKATSTTRKRRTKKPNPEEGAIVLEL